jgi:glycosyltransferase involved in cell wall biosynthesis
MKPLFLISCPFDTYSGYGARSRDVVKAIIETNKYNVKLISQPWGNTKFGFCKDNPEFEFLYQYVLNEQLIDKPEIWAQITVPNEFKPMGKYNIGFTAGIETTIVSGEWIEGMNRMDLNIVSSEHSKQSFLNSVYKNSQNNQELKINKPIEVLFEGVNIEKYFEDNSPCLIDFNIKESFAYLFVGHWLQGELGEDRKNVGLLVKAFYETFKNKRKKPALILKTSGANSSYIDRNDIIRKIKRIKNSVNSKDLPNIYLLHGDFTDEEMNSLYNHSKVKAMVSLTKGEGFGRPLLEFSLTKKPIITTNWSGQIDFLNPEFTTLLNGELKNVHPSAANNMILKESQWFYPNHAQINSSLINVFENYKKHTDNAKRQAYYSKTNFSWGNMKDKLDNLLLTNIPEFPKELELTIPELNLPTL